MEEGNKLPLKRVELSLTKFNEVAIPHHLNLLRQYKANIVKYEEAGEYRRVQTEQTHARRVASQLRTLLGELDALRKQVKTEDVAKFDVLTQRSRDLTLRAIMDYLDSTPVRMSRAPDACTADGTADGSAASTDSVGVVSHARPHDDPHLQLQVDGQELFLREREAVLRGWGELQAELRALHDAWQTVQAAALAHRTQVSEVSTHVGDAAGNVEVARRQLAAAERLRCSTYSVVGAVAGAAAGGPLGLVLGLKAGAAAALASSALGYLAGRVIGRKRRAQLTEATDDTKTTDTEHSGEIERETQKGRKKDC